MMINQVKLKIILYRSGFLFYSYFLFLNMKNYFVVSNNNSNNNNLDFRFYCAFKLSIYFTSVIVPMHINTKKNSGVWGKSFAFVSLTYFNYYLLFEVIFNLNVFILSSIKQICLQI